MQKPKYGAREGLADRLTEWTERLGKDKYLPWVGLGLVADLKAASAALKGAPEKSPDMEFDL
jgi:hypothetical protein